MRKLAFSIVLFLCPVLLGSVSGPQPASVSSGLVDMVFECPEFATVGEPFLVDVTLQGSEEVIAAEWIFTWNADAVEFLGLTNEGEDYAASMDPPGECFLPPGFESINETIPPADGDGLAMWLTPLFDPPQVPPLLLTSMEFVALEPGTYHIGHLLAVEMPNGAILYPNILGPAVGEDVSGQFIGCDVDVINDSDSAR